ncbi:YppG family protein [Halobacillus trueperi]|uniref:YppG family protein n=1 Tax=Halobacillus trueperi TaxID=156205 RepID=UPI003735671B
MYPYNPYYYYNNGWYRYPSSPPYQQANYQQMSNNQGNVWGYAPYNQPVYGFQNPYVNSYDYTGYTETGNQNSSFNVGNMSKGVMSYFQKEDGQIDFDKMMSTTGQVVKTVKDVSPIVKGIGTFVKGIK